MVNSVVLSHRDLEHALSFQLARKLGDETAPILNEDDHEDSIGLL